MNPVCGLVGRERELRCLNELLSGLPSRGAALVLSGQAGTGKSALVAHFEAEAVRRGARVLSVRGCPSEAGIPGAGIAKLLLPLQGHFPALPPTQRSAVESELALAPSRLANPLALCSGALSVLSATADEAPLVVTVDDVQWLDQESEQVFGFLAHRAEIAGIVILLTRREEPDGDLPGHALPELRLSGLSLPECRELAVRLGRGAPSGTLRALVDWTGGNPLAVVDRLCLGDLTLEQTTGDAWPPLPVSLERTWGRLWQKLPSPCRQALFVVVAGSLVTGRHTVAALSHLGLEGDALLPAEGRGLVVSGPSGPQVPYPLLRAVVQARTPTAQRVEGYRALAAVAEGHARVWFAATAASGPDEGLATALDEAARTARRREGVAASARLLHRAARLSPDVGRRAGRLVRAAADCQLAGDGPLALAWCEEAAGYDDSPQMRAQAASVACRSRTMAGSTTAAYVGVVQAAARSRAAGASPAAELLAEAAVPAAMLGPRVLRRIALRAGEPPAGGSDSRSSAGWSTKALVSAALVGSGEMQRASRCLAQLRSQRPVPVDPSELQGLVALAQALTWAERFDEAGRRVVEAVTAARAVGAMAVVPPALVVGAECAWWRGDFASAREAADEAARLAVECGHAAANGLALGLLARLEASRGERAQCEARLRRARRRPGALGAPLLRLQSESASGLALLACGELTLAASQLGDAWELARSAGLANPNVAPMAGDLAEVLARLGESERCVTVVAWLEERALGTGLAVPRALAARARGMLATDPGEAAECFAASLAAFSEIGPVPFQEARTLLCQGEALRRAREPAAARDPLARAWTVFEGLEASRWAARAEAELAATGVRVRGEGPEQRASLALSQLTPQERQVAQAVGRGLANREIADALFVSTKTVEAHLTRAYRKLRVRSRTELARLLLTSIDAG